MHSNQETLFLYIKKTPYNEFNKLERGVPCSHHKIYGR